MFSKQNAYEVHAHRGARDLFPENTLPAFQAAWESGADCIELDVQFTRDGAVVIHHNFEIHRDAWLHRAANSKNSLLIHSLSITELQQLEYGLLSDPEFPHQQKRPGIAIPTLDELIDAIITANHPQAQNIRLNIELKRDLRQPHLSLDPDHIVTKVLEVIRRRDFSHRVQYASFDPDILTLMRKKAPQAILACLFSEETLYFIKHHFGMPGFEFLLGFAKAHQINILCPDHQMLKDSSQIIKMHSEGFQVRAWTVNDPKRWQQLYEMGVNGVITDTPRAMTSFINGLKSQQLHP